MTSCSTRWSTNVLSGQKHDASRRESRSVGYSAQSNFCTPQIPFLVRCDPSHEFPGDRFVPVRWGVLTQLFDRCVQAAHDPHRADGQSALWLAGGRDPYTGIP